MGIQEKLIQMKLSFSAKYYEGNDFVTNFEIKQIIDNKEFFERIYQQFPLIQISTIDDYYNYLLSCKIICFETIIPNIVQNEHKEFLYNLVTNAKDTVSKIKNGDIFKLINTSYQSLLKHSFEAYGVSVDDATIDLITKYRSGISLEVKKYICQNLGNTVILRYDDFECILKDNPELFDDLFPQYSLEYIQKYSFKETLNVIAHIYNKPESPHYCKVNALIKALSNDIETLSKSLSVDNVMQYDQTIRRYIAFLRKIKHIDANRFEKTQRDLDKLLSESIAKNGHTFSMEIPINEIKAMLTSKQPIYIRILSITHTLDKVSLTWRSNLDKPPERKNPLMDMISTNTPTNDYFTFSHQRLLENTITVGTMTICSIFTDESIINEYLNGYYDLVGLIATKTHYDVDELLSDFELLAQMIGNIFYSSKDADSLFVHSLCYGAAVFICAFSEKILRLCYFEDMKDSIYIPLNKATIGTLLADSNSTMVKILGEYQTKHLNYFFGQDKDGIVGMSYRNRLAHWSEITENYLTPQFICQLFYLFTCIINSVSLYYNKRNEESNSEL